MPIVRKALWWLSLYALWWLLVGSWAPWNAVWGAGLVTLATLGAVVTGGPGWGSRSRGRRWPRELVSAALQVVLDFGVLVGTLATAFVRADRGPFGRMLARDTDAEDAARRAWVTLVATWSPNAYVVDVDAASGRALLHDLRPWRRSEEPV